MIKRNNTRILLFLLLIMAVLLPGEALALQVHGEPEGLYVHQMAHLHYIFALCYFFWDIKRSSFTSRGWKYLLLFCVLMVFWNVNAFIGHIAGVNLDTLSFLQTDRYLQTLLLGPFTLNKSLYFITKLDHLIYVPALFFLVLGLRSFYRSAVQNVEKEDR